MAGESLEALIARREAMIERVRRVLIDVARLRMEPDQIDPDAPLFGTGLGLDSVDALELVLGLEREFTVRFPEQQVYGGLRTVNSLVDLLVGAQAHATVAEVAS